MRYLLAISLLCSLQLVSAQTYWLVPVQNEQQEWCLTDVMQNEIQFCEDDIQYQNYNPLINLDSRVLSKDLRRENGLNIYTIYKTEKNNLEQFIWGLSSKSKEVQVLTDYRLADLAAGKVMNFVDFNPGDMHINNFLDYESGVKEMSLQLGGNANRSDLPIQANTAHLAELIAFENPLSPLGKSILETSLALKYSITLSPGTDYVLDSNKSIIWNSDQNKEFHHNIAGIAKNEAMLLHQKQSRSAIEKGFLAIGHSEISTINQDNHSEIPDGTSLVWGDNQEVLEFLKGDEGISTLQRQWLVENIGFSEKASFEMMLDEDLILDQLDEGQFLWMKVRQGNDSRLYSSVNNKSFENVSLFDGSQKIEFIKAPKQWVDVHINPANCEDNVRGALEMTVIGVDSPFRFQLTANETEEIIYDELVEGRTIHVLDLNAGKYEIKVIQNNELIVKQEINIQDESIPELTIPAYLILDEGDQNVIDASYGMSGQWEYEWTRPDGVVQDGEVMEFSISGTYWLKVSNASCFTYHKIHVELIDTNIKSILVYPNPSPNGLFHFELELENAFPARMDVTDVEGKKLLSKSYDEGVYIEDHFQLYGNGAYFITFTSGSSIRTKKLIVQIP